MNTAGRRFPPPKTVAPAFGRRLVGALDRLSLAGLDPFLRVGLMAAVGGAIAGLAVVLMIRAQSQSDPTLNEAQVPVQISKPHEAADHSAAPEGPSVLLADPESQETRPLDEIPPELVIPAQPSVSAELAPRPGEPLQEPDTGLAQTNGPPEGSPEGSPEGPPDEAGDTLIVSGIAPEAFPPQVAAPRETRVEGDDRADGHAVGPHSNAPNHADVERPAVELATIAPPPVPVLHGDQPMIAIVIDDMGLDRRRSRRTIALPGPLTLSYLTYAEDLPSQTRAAAGQGHELMLHVAMEPLNPDIDAGPDVLRTEHDEAEILNRLRRGLDRFDGFTGINNHMGSKFTADAPSLMTVMAELQRRDLFFLDSRTSAKSVADRVAFEFGVPFAVRNVFLDDHDDASGVAARLAQTERIAAEQGHAIAIGHPKDKTLEALATWIPGLTERGYRLVPVSVIVEALMTSDTDP